MKLLKRKADTQADLQGGQTRGERPAPHEIRFAPAPWPSGSQGASGAGHDLVAVRPSTHPVGLQGMLQHLTSAWWPPVRVGL